jgi:predicted GNAT family N-acyltransferase
MSDLNSTEVRDTLATRGCSAIPFETPVRVAVDEKELLDIFRLRYEIYIEQQRKPLPTANDGLRILRDDLDDVATNFYVGNDKGEIVACGRVTIGVWPQVCDGPFALPAFNGFRREEFYYISKVMLNPRLRSFSAIPSLFIAMYRAARVRNTPFGIAHCNPKLVPIYLRFGCRRFGPEFVDPFAGPQAPIIIVTQDVNFLRRTGSVLLETAEQFPNEARYLGWFEKNFPEYSILA